MHHSPPTRFAEVAATLAANGYRPVPIIRGDKRPSITGWERFTFTPGCEKQYPTDGAGILLGDVVALDIDVDDPDAAAAIENAAREVLGLGDTADTPRRIGQPPRVLLPFRCSAPFKKITTASYRMRSRPEEKKRPRSRSSPKANSSSPFMSIPTRSALRLERRRRSAHRCAGSIARDHRGPGAGDRARGRCDPRGMGRAHW